MEQKVEKVSVRAGEPDALGIYLSRARRHRPLNRSEEAMLSARIKAGDEEARGEAVAYNLKLVVSIARGTRAGGWSSLTSYRRATSVSCERRGASTLALAPSSPRMRRGGSSRL